MIPKNIENEVKERANNNIVSIISRYVNLRKKGISYEGLCPFHDDNHLGSFLVTPSKHLYKCFSCGASGDAVKFIQEIEKVDYKRAIEILGSYVGVYVYDDADKSAQKQNTPCQSKPVSKEPQQIEQREIDTLPFQFVLNAQSEESNLIKFFKSRIDADKVSAMVDRYHIGEVEGFIIYWQIDKTGKVRSGKMIEYQPNGHRYKDEGYHYDWLHSKLIREGLIKSDWNFRQCLFGEHLISEPGNEYKTIAVAESEKVALLGSIFYPDFVWTSCGSVVNLTATMLEPLKQRKVIIFPDAGFYDNWLNKVNGFTKGKQYRWVNNKGENHAEQGQQEKCKKLQFASVKVSDGLERAYKRGLVKYGDDLADLWLADPQPQQQSDEQEPTAKVIALPRHKTIKTNYGEWNFEKECFEFYEPNIYGERCCPF